MTRSCRATTPSTYGPRSPFRPGNGVAERPRGDERVCEAEAMKKMLFGRRRYDEYGYSAYTCLAKCGGELKIF